MGKIFKITEEQYRKLQEAVKDSILMGGDNGYPQTRCDTEVTADGKTSDGQELTPAKPKLPDATERAVQANILYRKAY